MNTLVYVYLGWNRIHIEMLKFQLLISLQTKRGHETSSEPWTRRSDAVSASLISLPILSASETRLGVLWYIRAEAKESYGVYMHEKSKELRSVVSLDAALGAREHAEQLKQHKRAEKSCQHSAIDFTEVIGNTRGNF